MFLYGHYSFLQIEEIPALLYAVLKKDQSPVRSHPRQEGLKQLRCVWCRLRTERVGLGSQWEGR